MELFPVGRGRCECRQSRGGGPCVQSATVPKTSKQSHSMSLSEEAILCRVYSLPYNATGVPVAPFWSLLTR